MFRFQGKLTRTGAILLALLVVGIVLNLGLRLLQAGQASTEDEWSTRVRRARIALNNAVQDSDLAPLEAQKKALETSLAESAPGAKDPTEVTLDLWRWAGVSKLELRDLNVQPGTSKVGDVNLVTYNYSIQAHGSSEAVQSFVATAIASTYSPEVSNLQMKHVLGKAGWEITLDLRVYSLGE